MLEFDWTGWTTWIPLIGLDFTTVPYSPGAYVIATSSSVNRSIDRRRRFPRRRRIGLLAVPASELCPLRLEPWQGRPHGGVALRLLPFRSTVPAPVTRVRWAAKETKAEAYRAEGHLLLAYLWRHAELPPLNYKFNWDAYEELGWDHLDQVTASQESSPPETP